MPRKLIRQTSVTQSQEGVYTESQGSLYGDSVLVNGEDNQAAQRAHMRAQTTARQAAERGAGHSLGLPRAADAAERQAAARVRETERQAASARIEADHQEWLQGRCAPKDPA